MTYFSAAAYNVIRSDPSQVVNYYNRYKAGFVKAAGLQQASEEVQIAAFCSVMAYDLAPYGSSKAGANLSELLSAKLLSCGQYVQLTLFLIKEFGALNATFHAVGWDDGAVGNHAQLFISTGQDSALLDPTIGLIVRGATLNGVATGAKYGSMTSFFDDDRVGGSDISNFNETVQTAVANGLYKIRDGIYDYPSLDAWKNDYWAHTGMIIGSVRSGWIGAESFQWAGTAYGGKGNDTITGSSGTDRLNGGKDNDTLYGLDGNDVLYGESGNDRIVGGIGADRMIGGTGNDTYWVDTIRDQTIETARGGHDRVIASQTGVVLQSNVEDIVLTGALSLSAVGNSLGNTITGNGASNVLKGMGGDDTIRGSGGNDVLQGGAGRDILSGGDGVDRFVFRKGETGIGAARDIVSDFRNGIDRIDLSPFDANSTLAGNQRFSYIQTLEFSAAGQVRTERSGVHLILEGDVNGDNVADFQILLRGLKTLWTGDLIL